MQRVRNRLPQLCNRCPPYTPHSAPIGPRFGSARPQGAKREECKVIRRVSNSDRFSGTAHVTRLEVFRRVKRTCFLEALCEPLTRCVSVNPPTRRFREQGPPVGNVREQVHQERDALQFPASVGPYLAANLNVVAGETAVRAVIAEQTEKRRRGQSAGFCVVYAAREILWQSPCPV